MRHAKIGLFSFALLALAVTEAQAQTFETRTQLSLGLPLQTHQTPQEASANLDEIAKLRLAQIFCLPNHSGVCLETNAMLTGGRGVGFNLLINFLKIGPLQVHLLDPGLFWNLGTPASVPEYQRTYDYVFGGGIDIKTSDRGRVSANCRTHIPEVDLIYRTGGYSVKAYRKATSTDVWCEVGYAVTWR